MSVIKVQINRNADAGKRKQNENGEPDIFSSHGLVITYCNFTKSFKQRKRFAEFIKGK